MASKRRIFNLLATLCQYLPDDAVQCFIEHCLTEPFHRLTASAGDDSVRLCEAVFSGLAEVAQLPHERMSPTLHSSFGRMLTAVHQLLPTPHQVSLTSHYWFSLKFFHCLALGAV